MDAAQHELLKINSVAYEDQQQLKTHVNQFEEMDISGYSWFDPSPASPDVCDIWGNSKKSQLEDWDDGNILISICFVACSFTFLLPYLYSPI